KEWLGDIRTPTQRDGLRAAIEAALAQRPKDMDALLALLQSAGWEVKRGKHIALRGPGQSRFKRLDSLGEGFTQDDLAAKLSADTGRVRKPNRGKTRHQPQAVNLIVDIQSRMRQGKGPGYERWARKYNLKEMARTLTFLREHDLLDMEKLEKRTEAASEKANAAFRQIQQIEARMREISQLKTHIIQYSKTREVYAQYKKSNWSPKFAAAHEQEIALHKAAKKAFDALGVKKLPKVSDLNAEYATLQREKDALYPDYKKARAEMRELLTARENVRRYLETDGQPTNRAEQNRKKIQS
ncbi:MAG: relaxase, partial [Clostridia bacterium]|nr:relaxase [Clostridia bacterium]